MLVIGADLTFSSVAMTLCCDTLHTQMQLSLLDVARRSGFLGCHEMQVMVFLCCAMMADRRNSLNC